MMTELYFGVNYPFKRDFFFFFFFLRNCHITGIGVVLALDGSM